jgi:hypothetical protein
VFDGGIVTDEARPFEEVAPTPGRFDAFPKVDFRR